MEDIATFFGQILPFVLPAAALWIWLANLNNLRSLHQRVLRSQSVLGSWLQNRFEVQSEMGAAVQDSKDFQLEFLDRVLASRERGSQVSQNPAPPPKGPGTLPFHVSGAVGGRGPQIESNFAPNLTPHELAMKITQSTNAEVTAARAFLQENIEAYEVARGRFPASLVASIHQLPNLDYFQALTEVCEKPQVFTAK